MNSVWQPICHWRPRGIEAIEPERGFRALWQLLAAEDSQVLALPIDWNVFCEQFPVGYKAGILSELVTVQPEKVSVKSIVRQKIEAAPAALRRDLLVDVIQQAIASALGVDRSEVPASAAPEEQRFFELGLDSLMAVELRNDLVTVLGVALPATILFQHTTTLALATYLAAMPDFGPAEVSTNIPSLPTTRDKEMDNLNGATEDDLLELLAQELAQI
jgi:phthiocerol/phenolphthiocerol synthesis type-I polyketide synthase D